MKTRIPRLLAVLVLIGGMVGMLVSGCGVQPTGVIAGTSAPRGAIDIVPLYFVKDGKLQMVSHPVSQSRDDPPLDSLFWLADGPTASEQAQGFTTEVPPARIMLLSKGQTTTIWVSTGPLSTVAVDQIVCTYLGLSSQYALDRSPPFRVVVTTDYAPASDARVCPAAGP